MKNFYSVLKIIFSIIFFGMFLFLPKISKSACNWDGNTCECPDATQSEIQNCINEIMNNTAGKSGQVILQLQEDSEDWSGNYVTINMRTGFSGITELIIRGYGADPGDTKGSAGYTTLSNAGFKMHFSLTKKLRISNFTLAGQGGGGGYTDAFFLLLGQTDEDYGFRVDHMTLNNTTGTRILASNGGPNGVVDHFYGTTRAQFSGWSHNYGDNYGNTSWADGAELGSINAVYLEDNEITFDNIEPDENIRMFANGVEGSRIVVRHNILTDFYIGHHDASTGYRGGLQVEVYDNIIISTWDSSNAGVFHRGGTGVIYNNQFIHQKDNNYAQDSAIWFYNRRDVSGWVTDTWTGAMQVCGDTNVKAYLGAGATDWGICTSGDTCLDIDGDSGTDEYPCRDQIGTGDNESPQSSKPLLMWNNTTKIGSDDPVPTVANSGSSHILKGRDYCEDETTMPTTCNGVTTTYVEFEYPHPLITGGSSGGGGGEGSDGGGGANGVNIDSGGCFTATAAYGNTLEPYVVILTEFRDHFLLNNSIKKGLVNLYNRYLSTVPKIIAGHHSLCSAVRSSLTPVMGPCWVFLNIRPPNTTIPTLLSSIGIIGFAGFRRKFKKR